MASERFVVIGLGRYGSRLAVNLARAGAEVIAIDRNREVVEEMRDRVTLAVAMDSTDEQALRLQGVDKVGVAVVAIGHDFEANALTTVLLKHIGVKRVISRAGNPMQVRILSRIGADSVVNPEDETADRWSHKLLAPYLIDHIELVLVTDSPELQQAISDNADYIKSETQADTLSDKPIAGVEGHQRQVGDFSVTIYLRVIKG